ncbi:ABC transporter permease [Oceanobacter mangrovi]|uniref:ABC transporter permease n=1 Tax=Oceanobacter mangrovi TaxID=2862510 RepID=UPI001C8F17E1|nr:ABC transporter permease [Oceanobacter mangrovi]
MNTQVMNSPAISPVSIDWRANLKRNQGLVLSVGFFALLILVTALVNGRAPSYFGISMLIASATTLALAAIGQSVIVIGGGLDLSVGAIVGFTQAMMVMYFTDLGLPPYLLIAIAVGFGMLAGAINGFFVSVVGLQPIIVTLATMFTLQGITLLILPQPGGLVPDELMATLLDDLVMDVIPGPVVVLVVALLVWGVIKKTSLGTSIFAAGSDSHSAQLAGIKVKTGVWASYVIGGGFYGAAGAFVAAQSGAADPLIGAPLLVSSLTAVMLGGTLLGGGRGSAIGSVFGALTLIAMVNLLLALGAPNYLTAGLEALVLLLAVVINRQAGNSSESEIRRLGLSLKQLGKSVSSGSKGVAPAFRLPSLQDLIPKTDRKFILPAWIGMLVLAVVAALYYGDAFNALRYVDRLLLLGAFLAVLVLGQGTVIMSGGFDLSIAASVTLCGVVGAMLMNGSDIALLWAVPVTLGVGVLIGLANGLLVAVVGLSPIVATLAVGGILQTLSMFVSGGTPSGDAAPLLHWLVNGKLGVFTPLSLLIFLFVLGGVVLMSCTTFARRLVSVGINARAAMMCGVNVRNLTIGCYVISGLCAGLAGLLLTGFLGRASLSLGDNYLLPTVAAVAVGGTLITGGRGHYLGMFGGVLALTALQILLSGTPLPPAVRDITLGLAVMLAVIFLRDKAQR